MSKQQNTTTTQRAGNAPACPIETLPAKYHAWFQRHYGSGPIDRVSLRMCCLNARRLPLDDAGIGPAFARLTADLAAADPDFGATPEEIAAIGGWPPAQLRTFRSALLEIFRCPDAPGGHAPGPRPDPLDDPVPTVFSGRRGGDGPRITVRHGATIEVSFEG